MILNLYLIDILLIKLSIHTICIKNSYELKSLMSAKKERKKNFFQKLSILLHNFFLHTLISLVSNFYSYIILPSSSWSFDEHTYQTRLGNAICKVSHACAARSLTTLWRSNAFRKCNYTRVSVITARRWNSTRVRTIALRSIPLESTNRVGKSTI